MHSGARGKSGSKAPVSKKSPNWVDYDEKEAEALVVELANSGLTASEIGMTLRDQYGIPSIKNLTGKKIEQILSKHKLLTDIPRDLLNLIKRSVVLQKHIAENNKDQSAKRGYILTVSKIRRLTDYYTRRGKLDKNWRYSEEKAALLVK
ncbi:MAG TPA: 30S ribosomal protein S15 [archaeon]|nr:30S ribosomal protein S15 [archaeon]